MGRVLRRLVFITLIAFACGVPAAVSVRTDHIVVGEGETVRINVLENDLPGDLTLVDLQPVPRGLVARYDQAGTVTFTAEEAGQYEIGYLAQRPAGSAPVVLGQLGRLVHAPDQPLRNSAVAATDEPDLYASFVQLLLAAKTGPPRPGL